jgi:hypothetical protein
MQFENWIGEVKITQSTITTSEDNSMLLLEIHERELKTPM